MIDMNEETSPNIHINQKKVLNVLENTTFLNPINLKYRVNSIKKYKNTIN